ncbi:hypothetical protein [uncultured Tateyamaria sp.]|uniref:hypothetical protein n=1 Tax=uncultured Tateyamaria sp. TaxID=455651 RepID=UPI002609148A|nr:hypothetical protein [uncultured Tateyamaria sp.]
MSDTRHPMAPEHLPSFITAADGSDYLFTIMIFFVVGLILLLGVAYFTLHALPERMAHKGNSTQLQLISVLAMLALFTHNNLFWVAALALAAFRPPDIVTPLNAMAQALNRIAGRDAVPQEPDAPAQSDTPDEEKTHA